MNTRRVAIVGCRPPRTAIWGQDIYKAILLDVESFARNLPPDTVIVSGGAYGVDMLARSISIRMCLGIIEHLPDYTRYGARRAPLERNTLIVRDATEVHAWPAPWSRGTWDTIRKAQATGKPVTVHEPWRRP